MDQILTTTQAAEMLGVSYATVLRWIKEGRIPSINKNVSRGAGCGYKVCLDDVNKLIKIRNMNRCRKPQENVPKKSEPDLSKFDKKSMRIAAANLRIAIEFAQEELSKLEALLKEV